MFRNDVFEPGSVLVRMRQRNLYEAMVKHVFGANLQIDVGGQQLQKNNNNVFPTVSTVLVSTVFRPLFPPVLYEIFM